jgi:hypothetical protein
VPERSWAGTDERRSGRLDLSGGALLDIQLGDLSIGHNVAPGGRAAFVSGRSFDAVRSSAITVTAGRERHRGRQPGAGTLVVDAGGS